MLELFPEGFEEAGDGRAVELAAYTDEAGVERARARFGTCRVEAVPEGWADEWKRFHRPLRLGALWVGPPWERPDAGAVAVVIDPGRAFGTGAHPTTRLCLELLANEKRGSVLDVGTGSGVLAIAAAKLGFEPVTAVDVDPVAVNVARANAAANGVAIHVERADATSAAPSRAALVIANVDLRTASELVSRTSAGRAILSGYRDVDELAPEGWARVARRRRAGWAADLFARG